MTVLLRRRADDHFAVHANGGRALQQQTLNATMLPNTIAAPATSSNNSNQAQYALISIVAVAFVLLCVLYLYCQRRGINRDQLTTGRPSEEQAVRRSALADR